MYLTNLEKVRTDLKNTPAVYITTDSWTSVNNESFTAVTAHYFNSNLELKTNLLECMYFPCDIQHKILQID